MLFTNRGWVIAFTRHFQQYFSYIMAVSFIGIPGENHRPGASHRQTLSDDVVSSTPRHERGFEFTTLVVTDRH
jgi:hypothetical protein